MYHAGLLSLRKAKLMAENTELREMGKVEKRKEHNNRVFCVAKIS